MNQQIVPLVLIVLANCLACAPAPTPAPTSSPARQLPIITPQPTILATATVPALQPPEITGFDADLEFDRHRNIHLVSYSNAADIVIARFDPNDRVHNQGITWNWEKMSVREKSLAVEWLWAPAQMRYCRFQGRETWLVHVLNKWIPRLNNLAIPSDPAIALHWQTDGPPLDQNTIYEALSRIKALALIPERPMCSYGHSHLGLIEYGGELILFTAPGWQKVTSETREIITTVWTIKEAMVIYYPQSLGWISSCPSESARLKNEYYSSIWLVSAEQALAAFVPADHIYWQNQEIPFQLKNIATQRFPPCSPPIQLPAPIPDTGCSQSP